MHLAVRMLGDVVLVGDQHDRLALFIQVLEQRHDLLAGGRIEITGRLVRKENADGY